MSGGGRRLTLDVAEMRAGDVLRAAESLWHDDAVAAGGELAVTVRETLDASPEVGVTAGLVAIVIRRHSIGCMHVSPADSQNASPPVMDCVQILLPPQISGPQMAIDPQPRLKDLGREDCRRFRVRRGPARS